MNLLDVQADPHELLQGRITSLPVPPLVIHLDGDAQGIKVVLDCFSATDNRAYGFSFSTDVDTSAAYSLIAENNQLLLREGKNGRLLQGAEGHTSDAAEYLFSILQRITVWEHAVALQNNSTKLDKDAVAFLLFECLEDGTEHPFFER